MFSGYCDHTGAVTLMGPRRMLRFHGTGVDFDYLCVCGATGHYDARDGRGRHSSHEESAVDAA